MQFTKTISDSEAKYYIRHNKGNIDCAGGGQASYNLPSEFLEESMSKGVLMRDASIDYCRKEKDGPAFVLNNEYKFKLGPGILWLIGDNYNTTNNKFIASINASNGKFQLYKTVYKKLNQQEYKWFVALYNKNLSGNELILDIDGEKKILTMDILFNGIYQNINNNQLSLNNNFKNSNEISLDFNFNIDKPHNRIIFGAPGTGKSHKLDDDKQVFGDNFERVTFHPNYSYSQFVGTYKPVPIKDDNGNSTITYRYVPGPFMRTYVKAIESLKSDSPKPFLLLIEEINRANVASVFGEVFQLLDRKNGVSEYEIEASEDIKDYLVDKLGGVKKDYEKIKIPANMYIWATMNSADQGVFPMDTAFKRRWEFEYIGINENSSGIRNIMVKLGSGNNEHEVNWNELRMAINEKLSTDCKVNEDKLIGPYFLSKDVIKVDETTNFVENNNKFIKAFKSKVIMYLYEDAAKQHKQKIFEGCDFFIYSSICEEFDKIGEEIFGLNLSTGSTEE